MKKVSVILLPVVFYLIFLSCPSPVLSNALEYCGYQNIYINMQQVPTSWGEWGKNNGHMWLYNQYMDIYRYHDYDGYWGRNGDNEFGGYPSDADLYSNWGFHWGSSDLAMTCYSWYCKCCRIYESDIVFNPAYSWTLDKDYAEDHPGSVILYDTCLLHELGHSWGMQDENEDYSYWEPTVMHAYNGWVVEDSMNIHVPEAWAIRRDYSNQESIPALTNMAVHSKYADGSHLNWANSTTNKTSYKAGESITVSRLTVENTGTTNLNNVHIRLYLSTDRYIDTYDTQIGDWYWGSFGSEAYGIYDFTTTVPSGLPDGNYYVGALITYNGYYEDDFWQDNTTHLWSRINISSPDLIVQSMTTDPTAPFPNESVTVIVTV